MTISYDLEPELAAAEFIDVLVRSTLAERRPVHDRDRIEAMLRQADVIVTARSNGRLVGVSRAISDRAYCTYLSDLAVDEEFQRRGIGRELIRRTHEAAGVATHLILLPRQRRKRIIRTSAWSGTPRVGSFEGSGPELDEMWVRATPRLQGTGSCCAAVS